MKMTTRALGALLFTILCIKETNAVMSIMRARGSACRPWHAVARTSADAVGHVDAELTVFNPAVGGDYAV